MSLIISSYLFIPTSTVSMFFLIFNNFNFLALFANCKVNIVSSNAVKAILTVAIITILPLPPSDSCNNRVKFDSRQGIKPLFFATNKLIHLFKANKDLFIEPTSLFIILLINEVFSHPAKSISMNFPKDFFCL